jgi:UDP-glucose 4-epimerase
MIDHPVDAADRDLYATFKGARTLVTGGAGFIAGHLTAALAAAGAEVILVDERPLNGLGAHGSTPPALHRLSVGSEEFRHFLADEAPFDYIFHLAARAYAADSVNAPREDFTTNLVATVDLLDQLRALGRSTRLVFASSAAVYGNPAKLPVEESDITIPISPYGVSKLAAERYVAVYASLYGLSAASLRLFSVYGPYQTKQVVYDFFAKLRASPDKLIIYGDGTQVRDLVYVADVARAFMVVAAHGRADGFAYNVAGGVGVSTAELADQLISIQGADAAIVYTGANRPGDPERWLGSSDALAALGWTPRYNLRDGLRTTAAWFNAAAPAQAAR